MTVLRNYLTQSISGSITSDDKEIVFCRDSNYLGEYSFKKIENKEKITNEEHYTNQFFQSMNDYPTSTKPMTVIYGLKGELKSAFFLAYDSTYGGLSLRIAVLMPENIVPHLDDQFGCIQKKDKTYKFFYIPINNAKNIYSASNPGTFTPIQGTYNTKDGTDKEGIKNTRIFTVLEKYIVMMGGENYEGIRVYFYNEKEDKLSFVSELNISYKPYTTFGNYYQIDSSTIYGGAVTYPHIGNTGYNILYSFTNTNENILTCDYIATTLYNKDMTSIQVRPRSRAVLSYFQGTLHYISYRTEQELVGSGTYYTIDGYEYHGIQKNDHFTNIISLSWNTLIGYHSNKVYQITLSNYNVSINELHTLNDKSCIFKIPGMPIWYVDLDVTDSTKKPIYYCSDSGAFPTLLPEGSTINTENMKEGFMIFPQSGSVDIHPSSQTLNKTFYCYRNRKGGFTL